MNSLDRLGDQGWFYIRALRWAPRALTRYKKEVVRIITTVTFGTGPLALIGGTMVIVAALSAFNGSVVGLQAYTGLDTLGAQVFTAFRSSPPTSTPGRSRRWSPGWG